MATTRTNAAPTNILVIDFGQLGDVVLSLPALAAIRRHYPAARITLAVGTACEAVAELAHVADAIIGVDRVALRDGNRLRSIAAIVRLVRDVRSRRFDMVIDLHSLPETNLLGFFSGASQRLYARRAKRSLDFLGTITAPPEDRDAHLTERYLAVLTPLGVAVTDVAPRLTPRPEDVAHVERVLGGPLGVAPIVGLFPGAGHPSRRWPLTNFASLAERLVREDGARVVVFLGPEEQELAAEVRDRFPAATLVIADLNLRQFIAALSRMSLLVSNDTGAVHLAAAVGAPVVVVMAHHAPVQFIPRVAAIRVVNTAPIREITVADVDASARALLQATQS